jgi:oxygen-dependent protoporphyrinogen oxidase
MIGIIGAGISGLTAAWHLQKAGRPYVLLEAAPQPGGYIQSRQEGSYLLELGPNSLLLNTADVAWLHELGLGDELLPANSVSKNRYLYRRGRYRVLPAHPLKLLLSNYFSWHAKRAILRELSNHTRTHPDETLSGFF